MKKAVLIVNPSSGGEKAKEFETLAEEKLKQLFDEVVVKQTEKGGDAEQSGGAACLHQICRHRLGDLRHRIPVQDHGGEIIAHYGDGNTRHRGDDAAAAQQGFGAADPHAIEAA